MQLITLFVGSFLLQLILFHQILFSCYAHSFLFHNLSGVVLLQHPKIIFVKTLVLRGNDKLRDEMRDSMLLGLAFTFQKMHLRTKGSQTLDFSASNFKCLSASFGSPCIKYPPIMFSTNYLIQGMVPFKKKKQSLIFQNYGKEFKQQSFKFIITMMKSLILYKIKFLICLSKETILYTKINL